jgi:hypothetical protein
VNGAAPMVLTLVTLDDATQISIDFVGFTSPKVTKPRITTVVTVDSFKCYFAKT